VPSSPGPLSDQDHAELALSAIDTEASLETVVAGFVPTPRFARVSFDSYHPVPAFPSQRAARDRLRAFAAEVAAESDNRPLWLRFWPRPVGPEGPRGIYLDGGYGVGKTHLLAATYHAADGRKAYLSFSELIYTIIQMGLQSSIDAFRPYRLICLDEFELDDIASTHMAATFLRGVMAGPDGSRVVATSNTLPTELGKGRFAAHEFTREIGQIAAQFEIVQIEGEDYRHRPPPGGALPGIVLTPEELREEFEEFEPTGGGKVFATHPELMAQLGQLHPIRYARLLEPIAAFFVDGLAPMVDQSVALRFVHFVDKVYDQQVCLSASMTCSLADLFSPEYRDKGYAKKYQRCLSRLHELLTETAEMRNGHRPVS
jgi:cell division protein ZapE